LGPLGLMGLLELIKL